MSTTQPQLDPSQIQGLPEGAILKPISQPTPADTNSIEGLPAGAILKPIQPNQSVSVNAPEPSFLDKTLNAARQSMAGQTVEQLITPPQDSKEHVAMAVAGTPGVLAYRTAKQVVDQAENMFKAPRENYQQAKTDFVKAVQDFHNKDYRNLASDVGSLTGDITEANPTNAPGVGQRVRELSEGARQGNDLYTPIAKDAIDAATLGLGAEEGDLGRVSDASGASKVGEAAKGVVDKAKNAVSQPVAKAKNVLGIGETDAELAKHADENLIKASVPGKPKFAGYPEAVAKARPDLQVIQKAHPEVFDTPQDLAQGIDDHIKSIEHRLQGEAESRRGADEAVLNGLRDRVSDALDDYFDEHKGTFDAKEAYKAKQKVLDRLEQTDDESGQTREPNLFEADNIRQGFNKDTASQFGSSNTIPEAEKAAKIEANKVIRNSIDQKYSELGIKNVQQWRNREANLIKIKDQLAKAEKGSWETADPNLFKSILKQKGFVKGLIDYIDQRQNNTNVLTRSVGEKLSKLPTPTEALTPEFNTANQ